MGLWWCTPAWLVWFLARAGQFQAELCFQIWFEESSMRLLLGLPASCCSAWKVECSLVGCGSGEEVRQGDWVKCKISDVREELGYGSGLKEVIGMVLPRFSSDVGWC